MKPNILVSITGSTEKEWQDKLKEINNLKIKEVALFLEIFENTQREKIYKALKISCVKNIPLVHIRHDMTKDELEFLKENYKTKYFTCHEENFVRHDVENWKGFYKDIYLEMNFDNVVSKKVKVEKIGGFCIDLAHFKVAMEKLSKDFKYVFDKKPFSTAQGKRNKNLFICNHINGWNTEKNIDMHTIHNLKDFDYLKTLPKFVFGKIIALETFNSIKEQIEFKKYLIELLENKF